MNQSVRKYFKQGNLHFRFFLIYCPSTCNILNLCCFRFSKMDEDEIVLENLNSPAENPEPPTPYTQEDFNKAFQYHPVRPSGT